MMMPKTRSNASASTLEISRDPVSEPMTTGTSTGTTRLRPDTP